MVLLFSRLSHVCLCGLANFKAAGGDSESNEPVFDTANCHSRLARSSARISPSSDDKAPEVTFAAGRNDI